MTSSGQHFPPLAAEKAPGKAGDGRAQSISRRPGGSAGSAAGEGSCICLVNIKVPIH